LTTDALVQVSATEAEAAALVEASSAKQPRLKYALQNGLVLPSLSMFGVQRCFSGKKGLS